MISLHFRVKFRVNLGPFGHKDIATVEDRKDVTGLLLNVAGIVLRTLKIPVPILEGLVSDIKLPNPVKLYDDRGVFIELV